MAMLNNQMVIELGCHQSKIDMALKWRPQFMAISDKNNDRKGQAYVVQGNGVIIGPKSPALSELASRTPESCYASRGKTVPKVSYVFCLLKILSTYA